jgi:hypothetical protein
MPIGVGRIYFPLSYLYSPGGFVFTCLLSYIGKFKPVSPVQSSQFIFISISITYFLFNRPAGPTILTTPS